MRKRFHPLITAFLWMLPLLLQASETQETTSYLNDSTLVSDLTVEQFSEVVKRIVQQTFEECSVEGDMKGKAKLNLDVTGAVTARIVCETGVDIGSQ